MKMTDGLLIAAAAVGMLAALLGLVDAGKPPLPGTTAARVNETPIPADELQSLLQRRAQEGAPVDQLLGTLDDMIDEELLIQRASELGILRRDSNVRVAIIQAMEKSILNEERGRNFSDTEVEAFYQDNMPLFTEPLRLQLEGVVVTDADRVTRLAAALEEGVAAREIAARDSGISIARLPPVPLSLEALARRYPQEVLSQLQVASEGDVLMHVTDRGTHLLRVLNVQEARVPPFDEIRLSVLNEMQIQRQDVAYDEYLAWLRQRADIRKNAELTR